MNNITNKTIISRIIMHAKASKWEKEFCTDLKKYNGLSMKQQTKLNAVYNRLYPVKNKKVKVVKTKKVMSWGEYTKEYCNMYVKLEKKFLKDGIGSKDKRYGTNTHEKFVDKGRFGSDKMNKKAIIVNPYRITAPLPKKTEIEAKQN